MTPAQNANLLEATNVLLAILAQASGAAVAIPPTTAADPAISALLTLVAQAGLVATTLRAAASEGRDVSDAEVQAARDAAVAANAVLAAP